MPRNTCIEPSAECAPARRPLATSTVSPTTAARGGDSAHPPASAAAGLAMSVRNAQVRRDLRMRKNRQRRGHRLSDSCGRRRPRPRSRVPGRRRDRSASRARPAVRADRTPRARPVSPRPRTAPCPAPWRSGRPPRAARGPPNRAAARRPRGPSASARPGSRGRRRGRHCGPCQRPEHEPPHQLRKRLSGHVLQQELQHRVPSEGIATVRSGLVVDRDRRIVLRDVALEDPQQPRAVS